LNDFRVAMPYRRKKRERMQWEKLLAKTADVKTRPPATQRANPAPMVAIPPSEFIFPGGLRRIFHRPTIWEQTSLAQGSGGSESWRFRAVSQ